MRKILVIVLIFLGVIIAVELGFLWYTAKKNQADKNIAVVPSPAVASASPVSLDDGRTKMLEHNFEEIYKNIVNPQPDVLTASVLTNTYQGKIVKIRHSPGVLETVGYHFDLFIQIEGDKGNTKAMFFTKKQIEAMEKQGFGNLADLKVGDSIQVTLTFSLLSPDGNKTTKLISSKIVKTN